MGLEQEEAESIANNAIAKWANSGKRPKIADLGVDNDKAADVLRSASLAEVFGLTHRHRYALVEVTPKFFNRVMKELVENPKAESSKDRWSEVAALV